MPRNVAPLTERDLEKLNTKKGRDIWKAVGGGPRGFTVRQTIAGSTLWYYRHEGRAALLLGQYRPRGAGMSMEDARAAANAARMSFGAGVDLHRERRAAKAARLAERVDVETVAEVFEDLMRLKQEDGNREAPLKLDRQVFNTHIRDRFERMPIRNLLPDDVKRLRAAAAKVSIENGRKRGGPAVAARVVDLLRQIVGHANEFHQFKIDDPTRPLLRRRKKRKANAQPRKRTLKPHELRAIGAALRNPGRAPCGLSESMALALLFTAYTLQRCGECVGATDAEIVGDVWRLPSERVKNHAAHEVPLSRQAQAVIARARYLRVGKGGPIFPSPKDSSKPMARHSISRAMNRLCKALEIEDARTHDLRRTGASALVNDLHVAPLTVSRVLNHTGDTAGGVEITMSTYVSKTSLANKREALEKWANELDRILGVELVAANQDYAA